VHFRAFLYLALGASLALPHGARAQVSELQASYDFLVTERAAGGVLFNFPNATGNYPLPGSFYDTAAYWGAYVCRGSRATCAVNDTYNALDYTLSPAPGAAGKLQAERVNAHNGANIYDAATWQIAVMLGSVKNKFPRSSPTSAYALASSLTEILHQSGLASAENGAPDARRAMVLQQKRAMASRQGDGPSDGNTAPGAKRAVTVLKTFIYNGAVIADGNRAYAFRTLAPTWLARDPLMDSPYASFITSSNLPLGNPAYATGKITWSDWKPITGENAWAFLIGPLQAAHIHYVIDEKAKFIPFKELAVQNALDVLPAFAATQSAVGGVYYAPSGTVGNEGDAPVNPHQISVENNLSLYAGLQILRATLQAELDTDTALEGDEKSRIKDALHLIEVMIAGGQSGKNSPTKGLLSFFKTAAWQNGGFVQGGLANDPGQSRDWVPTATPMAVDVETWGIAALGTKQIDQWFGYGASFELWQRLKTWGGYGVGKVLWGVGYSDQDGNGIDQSGAYRRGVMSAEWTAGAINAVRNMISAYGAEAPSSSHYSAAQKYLAALKQDEAAMLKAIATLRIDRYPATDFPGTPPGYAKLIGLKTKPYLYASKRYHIPFGWHANPLPSTASTAWVIMIADSYDPFGFGGAPN
jgi:hypothetical protein